MTSKYESRGVSATKDEVHAAIQHLDKGLYPNAFCKILPDAIGNRKSWVNLLHADTAGTKTSLAYLFWRETGDVSVWQGIAQDAIVMNLDDMACVGATSQFMLSNTIGRNKNYIPGEVLAAVIEGTSRFVEKMAAHGIHIHIAGGETADVGDIVRTIDVGYSAVAAMPKNQLIVNDIQVGDVIVGLSSCGQCHYEEKYNSGIGCNGLTSARHDLFSKYYATHYPESYDPAVPSDLVYAGKFRLTDTVTIDNQSFSIGMLTLSPTRTYLPVLHQLLKTHRKVISGIIHCTGGGQTKVKKFIRNQHVIKDNVFDVPPLFELIQRSTHTPWQEMYQVFNMGHRLEIYLPPKYADEVIQVAQSFGIAARIVGHVAPFRGEKISVHAHGEVLEY